MLKSMLCMSILATTACAGSRSPTDDDSRRSVPVSVDADASYAFAVAGKIARGAWDDWHPGFVPFVIVYPDEQWVFGSDRPLPGFETNAFSSSLGVAYKAPSWTRPDGARVAFDPPHFFAQADRVGDAVTFTIAAPSLAPFPASDWATVFAHEFFHTLQMTDARWVNDTKLISPHNRQRLAELFQTDSDVRASVSRELELYASRFRPGHPIDCGDLSEVAHVRSSRVALLDNIAPGLPKAERALERFEGIARYVEEKAYDLDEVTHAFRERESTWESPPVEATLRRRLGVVGGEYYYATGFSLARILDTCNPSWKQSFAGKDLFELATPR